MAFGRGKEKGALEVSPGAKGMAARRSSELPVHRPSGPEPLPDAKLMPLGGPENREQCWARLPTRQADRLSAATGERIEWWAEPAPGPGGGPRLLPRTVVFGRRSVCFGEPRVDSAHRPVYVLERFGFDPASHRRVDVISTPPRPGRRSSGSAVAVAAEPDVVPLNVPGLGPAERELIGNLPVRAQRLLIAPFDAQHPVRHCRWYYEGSPNHFPVFAVVLAGSGQATLAHGSRVIPFRHDDRTSHWSLVCRRVAVRARSEE